MYAVPKPTPAVRRLGSAPESPPFAVTRFGAFAEGFFGGVFGLGAGWGRGAERIAGAFLAGILPIRWKIFLPHQYNGRLYEPFSSHTLRVARSQEL